MTNTQKILEAFSKQVTKLAKINVGASKKGRKIDSSGDLRKSIKYEVKVSDDSLDSTFSMEDYGVLRDAGQLGHKKKILKGGNKSIFLPRGKGFTSKFPKVSAIEEWVKKKPIRVRDLKTNQFVTATPQRLKSLSFLIGRKIFNEGIQPGLFFSDAWNKEYKDLPDKLIQAFSEDIEEIIE